MSEGSFSYVAGYAYNKNRRFVGRTSQKVHFLTLLFMYSIKTVTDLFLSDAHVRRFISYVAVYVFDTTCR